MVGLGISEPSIIGIPQTKDGMSSCEVGFCHKFLSRGANVTPLIYRGEIAPVMSFEPFIKGVITPFTTIGSGPILADSMV